MSITIGVALIIYGLIGMFFSGRNIYWAISDMLRRKYCGLSFAQKMIKFLFGWGDVNAKEIVQSSSEAWKASKWNLFTSWCTSNKSVK